MQLNHLVLQKLRGVYGERPSENFLKKNDFLASILFDRPVSIPIVRLMQRLNFKVHPNIISLLSLPFALSASLMFFNNQLIIGAICYYVYFILDGVDGKWARLTKRTSKIGQRLEYYVCITGNISMYFGLWYSQYYLKGNWLIGGSIIFAHYIIVTAIWIFLQQPYYKTVFPNACSYYSVEEEGFGTFFFAPIFNIVHILLPILVALQFTSFTILSLVQKARPDIKRRIRDELLKI